MKSTALGVGRFSSLSSRGSCALLPVHHSMTRLLNFCPARLRRWRNGIWNALCRCKGKDRYCNESHQTLSLPLPPASAFPDRGALPAHFPLTQQCTAAGTHPEPRRCRPGACALPPRAEASTGRPAATRKVGGRCAPPPHTQLGAGYIESRLGARRAEARCPAAPESPRAREDRDRRPPAAKQQDPLPGSTQGKQEPCP